jgi:hypothetical protein
MAGDEKFWDWVCFVGRAVCVKSVFMTSGTPTPQKDSSGAIMLVMWATNWATAA